MKLHHLSGLTPTLAILFANGVLFTAPAVAQANSSAASDAQVESRILRTLAETPDLLDQQINATTLNGIVTLSGSVRTEAQRREAEQLAARTSGVAKVVDELTLSGMQSQPGPPLPSQDMPHGVLQSDGTYSEPNGQGGDLVPPPNGPQTDAYGRPLGSPGTQQGGTENGPRANGQAGQGQMPSDATRPFAPPPYGRGSTYPNAGYAPAGSVGYGQLGGTAVTTPSGTLLRIRVNQHLDSRDIRAGMVFDGIVVQDVVAGGQVAIPRGTSVQGIVVNVEKAGAISGRGELGLRLTGLSLGGKTYPIQSDTFTAHGGDKTIQSVNSTLGLGALGAVFGAVAGGGAGAAIGAGVGGAVGLGSSAASGRGNVFIPSEAVLTFRITEPVQLTTVSQAEMQRLAYGVPEIGPRFGRRLPPPAYYGGPVFYPYPRYYYRPYGYYYPY